MNIDRFIALRFLRARQKNRFVSLVAILAVGGITVGVAALIVSLSVMNGFEGEVRSRIINTTSHINVHSLRKDYISGWKPLTEKLAAREDILAASPFVYTKIPVAHEGRFDGVMLRGVIPSYEEKMNSPESTIVDGEWLPEAADSSIPGIVLGVYLSENLGVLPGDTLFVYGLNDPGGSRLSPKIFRFRVMGIFETGMYDFDAALAYTHLTSAQRVMGLGESVTGVELRIEDFYRAERIASRVEDDLGFPYYAISWTEMNKNLFSWMTIEKWGLFLLLTLIIAVAAFNIASTLIMVVMEKTSQIGILRAMGATARRIRRIFFIQGVVVGLIGTFLGVIIGTGIALVQHIWQPISLPPDVYSISALPVDIRPPDILAIAGAAMLITVISSIYPAWRAAKFTPIDAIRGQ